MVKRMARGEGRATGRNGARGLGAGSVTARLLVLVCLVAGQLVAASLAKAQCSTCVGDGNNDRSVTINELIQAVNNSLQGCDGNEATPSATAPTSGPTPTRTPPVGV